MSWLSNLSTGARTHWCTHWCTLILVHAHAGAYTGANYILVHIVNEVSVYSFGRVLQKILFSNPYPRFKTASKSPQNQSTLATTRTKSDTSAQIALTRTYIGCNARDSKKSFEHTSSISLLTHTGVSIKLLSKPCCCQLILNASNLASL